jgi:uncharacterized membrane protein
MLTRRFALSRSEVVTSSVAALVSTAGYLQGGQPYLSRGVVGDVLGFAVAASVALRAGRRVRHEAAICLAAIGAVLLWDPQWPLRIGEAVWWAVFAVALAMYLFLRRHVCD